jgi:CheY-like chemotaxis protein
MADGDGYELIRRIRAQPASQGGLMPAFAVSAEPTPDGALLAGYHVFVPKPYDVATLVGVLDEFLLTGDDMPSAQASWTVASTAPGIVTMVFVGYMRPGDIRSALAVLLRHLEERPCNVIADLRKITGFSLAVASVAERAVWARRNSIRHVRILGGSTFTRLVAAASCRVLGLDYELDAEGGELREASAIGASR